LSLRGVVPPTPMLGCTLVLVPYLCYLDLADTVGLHEQVSASRGVDWGSGDIFHQWGGQFASVKGTRTGLLFGV